jgi:RecA/RadA recombinase
LDGGIKPETVTTIYGEAETGKSTLALQCAVTCALGLKKKTLYVDCDNTFAPERLMQITGEDLFGHVADQIVLVRPKDFNEQSVLVDNLADYIGAGFGLVVVDTFNSLYRAQVAEANTKATFTLNRELNRQLAVLVQTAKAQHIPIILVSQVKALFDQGADAVAPVATRVLQHWADNTIALKPTPNPQVIRAGVKQNRNPQEVTCYLRITQTGIQDTM